MKEEKRETKQIYADSLKNMSCPAKLREFARQRNTYKYLSESVEHLTMLLGRKIPYEEACSALLSQMEEIYKDAVFDYPWQKTNALANDYKKIRRAFDYVMDGTSWIFSSQIECCCPCTEKNIIVRKTADLVIGREGCNTVIALLIHPGKSRRGIKCKSIETIPKYDPGTVTAKYFLERIYPKIAIWDVYLSSEKDTAEEIYPVFDDSDLKSGQLKITDYREFYKDGPFDKDAFFLFAQEAFRSPGAPACDICSMGNLCKKGIPVLEPKYDEEAKESQSYVLPEFTDEQKKIIEKDKGAFLVIAGPGSGKTATLVGRLKFLVCEKNVPPEFILAISFTNKAAEEIRDRCTFLKEGDEINITTLHALGYSILNEYASMKGEEPYRLLTKDVQSEMIDDLLNDFGKALPDFSYSVRNGEKGYLSIIASRLEEYEHDGYAMIKKRGMSKDFQRFADQYLESIKNGRFITFDGQISLCVEILEKDSEFLQVYQDMFWYVCVDEYQDVDEMQSRMIDLLSAQNRNLMAIGDDDQSIYEWRGASPEEIMLKFRERYPEGELFFLSRNFRSTGNIVDAASKNLADKLTRYDKEIVAVKGPGAPVNIIEGDIPETCINTAIHLMETGTRPEDIAVLSWSHKSLQEIIGCYKTTCDVAISDAEKCDVSESDIPKCDIPDKYKDNLFVEESETLIRSAFFTFCRCVLALKKDMEDEFALYEYFLLFALPIPEREAFNEAFMNAPFKDNYVKIGDLGCAIGCLKELTSLEDESFYDFCEKAAYVSGYLNQKVYRQTVEEMKLRGVESCNDFLRVSKRMIDAEDGKKLEADYPGKIVCTTIHEAKGREWKHVILIDDFGQKDSPQVRRLIYVALTRAIESLTIIKKRGEKSLLIL